MALDRTLPESFVYLDAIAPSIQSSLRYCSHDNFIGEPVEGYLSERVIMTEDAAKALCKAQALFKVDGYSIVVYDSYRPQTAVNHFYRWSQDAKDQAMKALFYPRINKADVFELGYIAKRSGHSRGSTIDLSLIHENEKLKDIISTPRVLNGTVETFFLDDGTVDMGSSFDLFDEASHYQNSLINEECFKSRTYLKEIMEACGFKAYAKEWWHFTLRDEPFPDTYFDFPVR
jgi:D-alanyl-D-alanine dipeptidase